MENLLTHRSVFAATLVASLLAAAPAFAADAPPPPPPAPRHTVTALGNAVIAVAPTTAHDNTAIRAAVAAARDKAGPAALSDATIEAQKLAASAGWTLGETLNIAEVQPSPFTPFSVYGADGTFGPNQYCGTIRTPIFRRSKTGRRMYTGRSHSHYGCRIPTAVTSTLSVTFAAS